MDPLNWTVLELMMEDQVRERRAELKRLELADAASDGHGLKEALASTLVRWGLNLDPAAGDQLERRDGADSPGGRRQEAGGGA